MLTKSITTQCPADHPRDTLARSTRPDQWKAYLDQKAADAPQPYTHWQDLKAKIIQTFKNTNNVSAIAKLCKCSYYTANDIVRKDKAQENRERAYSGASWAPIPFDRGQ